MRLLLDTHSALWAWSAPEQLSKSARYAMLDPANSIWVSAVSAYEISLKVKLGKLPPLLKNFGEMALFGGFDVLDITSAHASLAGSLALEHRDPWDRLIAAQAMTENLTVVTADRKMPTFGVKVLW
jgi:PIN domain nuclease of toxin-antitoxin system